MSEFVVGINDTCQVLRRFDASPQGYHDAVSFIDMLEGAMDGLYYLDGPELSNEFLDEVNALRTEDVGIVNIIFGMSDVCSIAEDAEVDKGLALERATAWAKHVEETASTLVNEQMFNIITGDQP